MLFRRITVIRLVIVNDDMTVTLCSNKAEIGRQIDVNRPDEHNSFFEVRVKGQDFWLLMGKR